MPESDDGEGDTDAEGLTLALGEAEADGLRLALADGETDRDALTLALRDDDGEIDADGLTDVDADGLIRYVSKLPSASADGLSTKLVLASGTTIDQMLVIYHVPPGAPVSSGVTGTITGAPGPGSAPYCA